MQNNFPLSEKEMMEITKRVMSDKSPLDIRINIMELWVLISLLQLVTRDPELSEMMKQFATHHGKQFQKVIADTHPEANQVIELGWNTRFDVEKSGSFVNPHAPKEVHNIYTLYEDDKSALLSFEFRPQDWGDPRWQYRKAETIISIDGQEYRHISHFWIEKKLSDADFFDQAWVQKMLTTILLPGCKKELCARDFLREDDFWSEDWGKMPPHFDGDECGEDF
jgi:hypothetical protein